MIHRTDPAWQVPSWQRQLADAFTDPGELLRYLEIDQDPLPSAKSAQQEFSLRVPRWFAGRMEKGNPDDPLLRQVIPLEEELILKKGFLLDPVSDLEQSPIPGLLHKYQGRALLIVTGACAVNCRYCFRRHFPYADFSTGPKRLAAALTYLEKARDINEVILSGGDPLMLPDNRLAELLASLRAIPHIRRIRIHTRLPVVLPDRLTPELTGLLTATEPQSIIVLHVNHPRELSHQHRTSLAALRQSGVILFNQSVLLKGVNDDTQVLCDLSEKLFSVGVLPYYLHQLDRVAGAAHFEIADKVALDLHQQLRAILPGYLVPGLVREQPGAASKTPLQQTCLQEAQDCLQIKEN